MASEEAGHGFPSQEEALELSDRVLEGDPVAPSDVAQYYLEPLARYLNRKRPDAEESDCFTAAEDAILSLIKNPGGYDPSKGKLDAYLRMAAGRDLMNLQRAEWRHRRRRADWGSVEISPVVGKYLHDESGDPARVVELQEQIDERTQLRAGTQMRNYDGLSPQERTVLQLIQIGERRTELYATVLDITHLPPLEQQREVKRVKDRLKIRIKRAEEHRG